VRRKCEEQKVKEIEERNLPRGRFQAARPPQAVYGPIKNGGLWPPLFDSSEFQFALII